MRTKNVFYRRLTLAWFVALTVLMLSSCVNHRKVSLITEDNKKAALFDIENPRETSYKIQTGDQLYIKVHSLDPQTSRFFQSEFPNLMNQTYLYLNSYTVDEDGFIGFSFVDKLKVQGLTIMEAQKTIQTVLNEYFTDVNVVVKLVNFQVSLLGEVNSPGTYLINREYANILQALSLAGGVTEFAEIKRVKLVRQTPTGSVVKMVDLSQLSLLSQDYYHLMPNDVIYIDHRPVKSFTQRAVPYGLFLSVFSTALVIYNFVTAD
jgi:polysaccharide biosynthesis/export protein